MPKRGRLHTSEAVGGDGSGLVSRYACILVCRFQSEFFEYVKLQAEYLANQGN